ncbi:hypothetical protein L6452_14966 [Arctium lappa]|uniref:Uncharacterized protein n=1 Tax=Arctium lappa TaxID=4217 RepID=A0ACB9CMH5_ARCLA|nr:hypothetical protein L6452_14966 [Arctium lappa]
MASCGKEKMEVHHGSIRWITQPMTALLQQDRDATSELMRDFFWDDDRWRWRWMMMVVLYLDILHWGRIFDVGIGNKKLPSGELRAEGIVVRTEDKHEHGEFDVNDGDVEE